MEPKLTKGMSEAQAANFISAYRVCAASVTAMAVIAESHEQARLMSPGELILSVATSIAETANKIQSEAAERWRS